MHHADLVSAQKPSSEFLLLPHLLQVRPVILWFLKRGSARLFLRLVGTQPWTTMDTHSNKAAYKLTVLKPDTTYQVKVLTQCLSKLHKSNELITVRTPEGRE